MKVRIPCTSSYTRLDVDETRNLDENTLLDLDSDGRLCAITIEHARERMTIPGFSFEQISA